MSVFYKMLAKMKARSASELDVTENEGVVEKSEGSEESCDNSGLTQAVIPSQPVFPGVPDEPPVPPSQTPDSVQSTDTQDDLDCENIPLSVIKEEDKIPLGNTPPGPVRPMERQQLRPWLIEQINKGDIKGLEWIDQNLKVFKIPWKHRSRCGWKQEDDACLFKRWAVHTGRFVEGKVKADPRRWKANFRCAVNSRPDIEEVKAMTRKTGTEAYRVYRFLPESEGRLVKNLKNKFEKETRRSTKEYLSYVLHQHQQVRQEEPMDLTVSDTTKPNRDIKSLEAARALAEMSKQFTKDQQESTTEADICPSISKKSGQPTQHLESRYTDKDGYVWEVLRVKPETATEEQESVSSDGDDMVDMSGEADSQQGESHSNITATPNPVTYIHAGLLSGGGLQPPNDGETETTSQQGEEGMLTQADIITRNLTPMYSTAPITTSASLASRHQTMKRALEQEPRTSLAGLLTGELTPLSKLKESSKESSGGEPNDKKARVEVEGKPGTSFMSGNGDPNSASRALLAAAAKHRMPMMMKDGQSRTALPAGPTGLPANVIGIKPTLGTSPVPIVSSDADSFYRYNPLYGQEESQKEADSSNFYRFNPMYGDEESLRLKAGQKGDQLKPAVTVTQQKDIAKQASFVMKLPTSTTTTASPVFTPIIVQPGSTEASRTKTTLVTPQAAKSLLASLQKGGPVGNRRHMPNNVTVRTLLAATRAASGKADPVDNVVHHNVKEILHSPAVTVANKPKLVNPGTTVMQEPSTATGLKPLIPLLSLSSTSNPQTTATTPTTPNPAVAYSLVPDSNSIYLTNMANFVESTKKDLKQTEEHMGEKFNTMEENIHKAVLEAYRSRLPDLVAQTVREIMERHVEPLKREVAVEIERLKQQVAQLEQVQMATHIAVTSGAHMLTNDVGGGQPMLLSKPTESLVQQLHTSSLPSVELTKPATILRPTLVNLSSSPTVQLVPALNKPTHITFKTIPETDKATAPLQPQILFTGQALQGKTTLTKPVMTLGLSNLQAKPQEHKLISTEANVIIGSLPRVSPMPVAAQLLQLASQVVPKPTSTHIADASKQTVKDNAQSLSCTTVPAISSSVMTPTTSVSTVVGDMKAESAEVTTPPLTLSVVPTQVTSGSLVTTASLVSTGNLFTTSNLVTTANQATTIIPTTTFSQVTSDNQLMTNKQTSNQNMINQTTISNQPSIVSLISAINQVTNENKASTFN